MDTKYYLHSKQFWGIIASLAGFAAIVISQFFGHDAAPVVSALGGVLQVFGIPFTFYGATTEPKLGFVKSTSTVTSAKVCPSCGQQL